MERLAQFQLPGAHHWILKVIQSLHLSGATQMKLEAGITKVVLQADAVPKGFDSMDDLLTQLLADSEHASPPLRHLAAGMQGCLAVQPRHISMSIHLDGQRREYVLKSGGWRDLPPQAAEDKLERFELRLDRSISEKVNHSWFLLNTDIFDLLFRRKAALEREYKVVDQFCNFAHCRIHAGGQPANLSSFGKPRFAGYDIRSDPKPGSAKPMALRALYEPHLIERAAHAHHHLAELVVPSEEPGGFMLEPVSHATCTNRMDPDIASAGKANGFSRAFAIRMEMAPSALLVFWEDGVILDADSKLRSLDADCPGLVALINAKHLGKDLSSLKVLEDKRLAQVFEEVREAGRQLKAKIASNLHLMPAQSYLREHLKI